MHRKIKLTVIGLGEVGCRYARGLADAGAQVSAYSRSISAPEKRAVYGQLEDSGVELCSSPAQAVQDSSIVLVTTTAHNALETARSVQAYLAPEQIYVELNSAVPEVKKQIEALLLGTAQVVDGATMASVKQLGHKTPINLSGERAAEVSKILNDFGMNTVCIGDEVGQAAAIKVLRSVFMKGFEAVLVECMQASRRYGVDRQVFSSILQFFDTKPLPDIMHMLITTDAVHSLRRAEEMTAIIGMLEENGLECTMSKAAEKKLLWVSSLGMSERFGGKAPDDIDAVLGILSAGG